jgi:UDPglucose--hexose-1-phosphate uridylyltransferase
VYDNEQSRIGRYNPISRRPACCHFSEDQLRVPELRRDPITGRWVIIATDRSRRPSDFQRQSVPPPSGRFCPFCPGFESKTPPEVLAYRSNGSPNQPGWTVRVVPNKFPVLGIEGDLTRQGKACSTR